MKWGHLIKLELETSNCSYKSSGCARLFPTAKVLEILCEKYILFALQSRNWPLSYLRWFVFEQIFDLAKAHGEIGSI